MSERGRNWIESVPSPHSTRVNTPPTPEALSAVVRGDRAAREELVARWLPVVLRWCTCLGGPRVDPEDAAHDVMLVMLDRLPSLGDAGRYPQWLYGITRRVLAGHRRTAWVTRWLPIPLADWMFAAPTPRPASGRDELTAHVQRLIDGLPLHYREVLVLCEVEERSDVEVAEMLGVPLGTVKSRLRRARERFEAAARRSELHLALADLPEGG